MLLSMQRLFDGTIKCECRVNTKTRRQKNLHHESLVPGAMAAMAAPDLQMFQPGPLGIGLILNGPGTAAIGNNPRPDVRNTFDLVGLTLVATKLINQIIVVGQLLPWQSIQRSFNFLQMLVQPNNFCVLVE